MRSLKLSLAISVVSLAALAAGCAKGGAGTSQTAGANANAAASSSSGAPGAQPSATVQTASPAAPAGAAAGQTAGAPAQGAAGAGGAKADACALLTSDDVKAVQGEPVKDSKASQRSDGSLAVSQCFFSTQTFNKSVSLEVTRGAAGTSARKFWEARFERAREEGGKGEREREREREREKREREKKGERKGEEEEEESLPTPVRGIGDEAYWASSHVNGILYVLKGDAFIRVSIGGADDNAARLKKSKALAQKAISRL
jgi:hypothetical protein